jgi:hypothetical protein
VHDRWLECNNEIGNRGLKIFACAIKDKTHQKQIYKTLKSATVHYEVPKESVWNTNYWCVTPIQYYLTEIQHETHNFELELETLSWEVLSLASSNECCTV